MTKFLRTANGGLINADRIASIRSEKNRHGVWRAVATVPDHDNVPLSGDLNTIERMLRPVVPAEPGYTLLRYYADFDENGDAEVERYPIVAWRIEEDCATLVTPVDDDGGASNFIGDGVLMPDGRVIWPYQTTFASEAEWRAAMERIAPAKKSLAADSQRDRDEEANRAVEVSEAVR
jgi:hypothetical protein